MNRDEFFDIPPSDFALERLFRDRDELRGVCEGTNTWSTVSCC